MGKHQARLMRFALRYPVGWHGYGTDQTTTRAVFALARGGFLELSDTSRQFRLALPRDRIEVAPLPDVPISL